MGSFLQITISKENEAVTKEKPEQQKRNQTWSIRWWKGCNQEW